MTTSVSLAAILRTSKGVFWTADALDAAPTWVAGNTGLGAAQYESMRKLAFDVDDGARMFMICDDGAYRTNDLWASTAWTQQCTNAQLQAALNAVHDPSTAHCDGDDGDPGTGYEGGYYALNCDPDDGYIEMIAGNAAAGVACTQYKRLFYSSDALDSLQTGDHLNHDLTLIHPAILHTLSLFPSGSISREGGDSLYTFRCGWAAGSDAHRGYSSDGGINVTTEDGGDNGQLYGNPGVWPYHVRKSGVVVAYLPGIRHLWRSINNGILFTEFTNLLDATEEPADNESAMAMSPEDFNYMMYVDLNAGIHKSITAGISWSTVSVVADAFCVGASPTDEEIFAIGCKQAEACFHVTEDHGTTWTDKSGNLVALGFTAEDIIYEIILIRVVSSIILSGEACAMVDTDYSYTATVSSPSGETLVYTWSPTPDSGQGTDTAVYNWDTPQSAVIEVTADNGLTQISESLSISIASGSIRTDIYTAINAVSGSGQVHDYKRVATLSPDFLSLFKDDTTVSVRGLEVEAGPFTEERVEFRNIDERGILRTWAFVVHGYVTWDDAAESEKTAQLLASAVMDALDDDNVLHGCHYYETKPAQLTVYEPRLFGNILVHYLRIEVAVTEYLASGTPTGTTSAGTVREDIYDVVAAVTGAGQVYDYKRWAVLYPDYLSIFKDSATEKILGFDVESGPVSEERIEFRIDSGRGILRTHTFYINGYLSWNDSAESEKTAEGLAESVANALDDSSVIHGGTNYYAADPAQLIDYEPRLFGNILVHYIRIQQNVMEYMA